MQLPDIDFTSNQAVFDHVVEHLLEQGERCGVLRAGDSVLQCKYRSGDMACAIGCLLTDEEAAMADGLNGGQSLISHVMGYCPTVEERLRHIDLRLLEDLQNVHDDLDEGYNSTELRKVWRQELEVLAKKYNLVWRHGETGEADAVT